MVKLHTTKPIKAKWDRDTERFYETGVEACVLFVKNSSGDYGNGVAWNGISSITETPSGGDINKVYADNMKYLAFRAPEEFGGTIEAYTYPDEWMLCDGSASPTVRVGSLDVVSGLVIGQQKRMPFGLAYVTRVGNDIDFEDHGYKLHLVYNATASVSQRQYQTINDSPEAITFSWEFETTKVPFESPDHQDYKPVSVLTIDSRFVDHTKLGDLEQRVFGTDNGGTGDKLPELPSPDEVLDMLLK